MDASRLNPDGFYEFRLGHGTVVTREGARMVVVPDAIVQRLVALALAHSDASALRSWGAELGVVAAGAAGHRVEGLTPESATDVISGALALAGLGHASIERWGDLLAVRVESSLPVEASAYAALLAGLFESMLEAEVACVPVGPENRFVIVNPSIADLVQSWVREGAVIADIASRLFAAEGA